MKDRQAEENPAAVARHGFKQAGEIRARWAWVEPSVWTERMLAALEDGVKGGRWFSLIDKVHSERNLRAAFAKVAANRGAPGVDHQTIEMFAKHLDKNLEYLRRTLADGSYRPQAIRRVWIPKPGKGNEQRPLGIPTVRDRVVQAALRHVLEPIFERDFAERSYGFRPGRGCKDALRRVDGLLKAGYTWVVDADLKSYFDLVCREWLIKFLEHRIGDRRILRLIRKWLRAGVSEEGQWSKGTVGTPQGAMISPLLANVYLHYVFDLWIEWWRKHCGGGDVVVVRYADDFVIGFENYSEAMACLEELRTQLAKFGLKLHEGKTRLIEFGRYAIERRKRRDEGRPETFDFLGFTHQCAQTRKHGWFTIHRHSVAKRMRATLQAIRVALRKRLHRPLGETARWLRRVVQGWLNYHAVPNNSHRIGRFVDEVARLWLRAVRRRSQRGRRRWTWARMQRFVRRHLPRPHIIHPYPNQRFRA